MENLLEKLKKAKKASSSLALLNTKVKNEALAKIAEGIEKNQEKILEENEKDIKKGQEKGLSKSLLDRILLNEKRLKDIVRSIDDIIRLPDPVGEIISLQKRPNGMLVGQMRVPIGVIALIYEARPNVTVDGAILSIKTGNAIVLRGSSDALYSNIILAQVMRSALKETKVLEDAIQVIESPEHSVVEELLQMREYIDVAIPRGSTNFINYIMEKAKVPVIETGAGNNHIYVDEDADFDMARKIIFNAKVQRPSVCNAIEKVLVHKTIADKFIPLVVEDLKKVGVEIRGCERVCSIVKDAKLATEEDWYTEYLDLIIGIKVVDSLEDAIEHINKYNTKHSEGIITESYEKALIFLREVDAAAVYVNASTRFTDGGEFGLGAEIGISTQKLHARGPMGLKELTTTKYIVFGEGQIRE
ncbi:MAG TPA: glutamate-5-semialdehyde dehydrogenase [Dictyoglomaceae bacterium]|nr:glutamate-5-semialdehyde dehydrogenase [Dictyoglomaceae bacterium]HOL38900.1 glutamate-5-semialdehyde dehydrogenase [Dictyoglomaceae bacterium]HOP94912.1 glutamate-5-semialdehyde dehydrogenase [Dictyoglomaceae bacterium]HPP15683.1 glutamate-5-semialdehyde dehydrogenase [Dictyoglomaceae bacterium]HPU43399.1 glutamate-5-semialdehyde dehydrogenase [Dictyoglomaceae bacterium]